MSQGLIQPLLPGPVDIVGDVHGEIDALADLLGILGYDAAGGHRDGRRLVFIGDLTDRGPDSPAVLERVMGLVARGMAQCVLGNHELNLLRAVEKVGNGWYFDVDHDHAGGLFRGSAPLDPSRRAAVREFLSHLPVGLERDDLRVVHAAWHGASIDSIRRSPGGALELYLNHQARAMQLGVDVGLAERGMAEAAALGDALKNPDAVVPLLPNFGALDALHQDANPVSIVTSGLERMAKRVFFASGKWRMVDRYPWWNEYRDDVPVIIGHYWRWPSRAARESFSRGEPDLFEGYDSNQWLGARKSVFCVDFSVGARYQERAAGHAPPFECRLGAVRWPERELVMDDGARRPLRA